VDLDRSIVELAAATRPRAGCPACAGGRFGFPGELAEARAEMCPAHRAEAERVIRRRLDRAEASNPDGWGALGDATRRSELPHLPNGLATKLVGAEEAMYVVQEPDKLAARARVVVEAAAWFPGRRNDFAIALGEEPELAGQLPDWLVNLVAALGHAGLGAEAAMVGDALERVAPDLQAFLDGDVAVALAKAGLAEQARARVESNLTRWPDDFWIRLHAGDALAALGERDAAVAHFEVALTMADDTDDFEARSYAVERLMEISGAGREPRRRPSAGKPPKRKKRHSAAQNKRKR
jgi:tetratricopeptide (TPR) repeat protein